MDWNRRLDEIVAGSRMTDDEFLSAYHEAELLALGKAAAAVRDRRFPEPYITFVIDRNINYTNICTCRCKFCAFYRDQDSPEAYLLSWSEIRDKIDEAVALGATQLMLQGGLNPALGIEYYEDLFGKIRAGYPAIALHSLSAPEICHIAEVSSLSVEETLRRLMAAGLSSLPGGGAEILDDGVRQTVSPKKIKTDMWLSVMETAHRLGMKTTATMMMGSVDRVEQRLAHLSRIRAMQDKTGGYRAFIAWTYQPGNNELMGEKLSAPEYLRMLAISRLYLDNVDHIQGSWVTMGPEIGQLSILFGADDLGSTMIEENVVRAAGLHHRMSVDKVNAIIAGTGRKPAQRDTTYRILKTDFSSGIVENPD
ncbi:MAG: cyclic dehypoxanthinyl futalosine synthase [Solirubrobacterales bacterium]